MAAVADISQWLHQATIDTTTESPAPANVLLILSFPRKRGFTLLYRQVDTTHLAAFLQKAELRILQNQTSGMRILLLFYIVLFLTLNFLIDHDLIFLLALSTFPATVYLLIKKSKKKQQQSPSKTGTTQIVSHQKEDSR